MIKYDLFNKLIDYLHGRDKQPDLKLDESSAEQTTPSQEKEFIDNFEMVRKLDKSPIEPDPKFSKRLLNEIKMELKEQTSRRVKFPIWRINFRVGWMAYTSAIIIAVIFSGWGFIQIYQNQSSTTLLPQNQNPLLKSQINRQSAPETNESKTISENSDQIQTNSPAPLVQSDLSAETFSDVQTTPQQPAPDPPPSGHNLDLGDMPQWPAQLEENLTNLESLIDELENFGSDLNSLDSDLDSF